MNLNKLKAVLISFSLLHSIAFANSADSKKDALLIGISHYQNGKELPGIDKDLKRMRKMLENKGYSVKVLTNEDATYSNVVNILKDYARNLNSKDTFVWYVSTHGTQVPDLNGDEEDGKDEAYVLYEATMHNEKGLLIDDETDRLLSKIKAKKFVLNDTCHSGTIYKSFGGYNVSYKFLPTAPDFKYTKNYIVTKDWQDYEKPEKMVAISASEDKGLSIATADGSLFTEAFIDIWKSDKDITFKEMKIKAEKYIANASKYDDVLKVAKPTLYATKDEFKNEKIDNYLDINININQNNSMFDDFFERMIKDGNIKKLNIQSRKQYKEQEAIVLNIDKTAKGEHLYILKEKDDNLELLFPNKFEQDSANWSYNFPNENAEFVLRARLNDNNSIEHSKIYAILSPEEIDTLEYNSSLIQNSFKEIIYSLNNYIDLKNATKAILIKRKNRLSIGQCEFDVIK